MSESPSQRWQRIDAILDRLFELEGQARERELLDATEGDEDLRREVRALLAADASGGAELDRFLDAGVTPLAEAALAEEDTLGEALPSGKRIGPYVVDRLLGSGGMSLVHLGRRHDGTFQQEVAIKVLRHPGRHPDIVRRFQVERQILAHLRHDNIARILDGGVADGGWPYLVMEYVDGLTLTEYCARHRVSLEQRLELFTAVCDAVHHAHQRLVVHRDLKPSNILVTKDDRVKLLDFGIAKLLDAGSATLEETMPMTETGLRLFTPDYAAPEQVRGEEITTATDVYALGVILYELLSGQRPYELTGRPASDVERIVCEQDPIPPSATEVRTGAQPGTDRAPADVAANRHRARLRGDLDTICLKALRKEPDRRYASVQDLANDLERYRDGLPVAARPATAGYRFSKFVRRNRMAVSGFVAALAVSFGLTAWATLERHDAERARRSAELEAERATVVTDFMLDLLRTGDPQHDRADTLRVRDLLERAVDRADELQAQPVLRAEMLQVAGRAYASLREHERAYALGLEASETLEDAGLADTPDHSQALALVGIAASGLGRHDEAVATHRRVIAMREATEGPRHHVVGVGLNALGQALMEADRHAEAESVLTAAVALLRSSQPAAPLKELLSAEGNLATSMAGRGEFVAAAALTESVLVRRQRIDPRGRTTEIAVQMHNLAAYSRRLGAYARAESLYREANAIRREHLPSDHPSIAMGLDNLAIAIGSQGRLDEAESHFLEALELRKRYHGERSEPVAASYSNLSTLEGHRGRPERSLEYARLAVTTLEGSVERPHRGLANAERNLASVLSSLGRLEEARPHAESAIAQMSELAGRSSVLTAEILGVLAHIRLEQGAAAEAESLRRESLEIYRAQYGDRHPELSWDLHGLGAALAAQQRIVEADSAFAEALSLREEFMGAEHPKTRESAGALAALRNR